MKKIEKLNEIIESVKWNNWKCKIKLEQTFIIVGV